MTLKKIIIIISSVILLSGCVKTTCISHSVWQTKCEKKVDWNNPGFTVVRTIITQGANAGK
tara:strand:+ start:292 stop:474 length:183 start_codon:yes stop_codon:yes gene_type:complete